MTHNSKDHITDVWKLIPFFKTCVWVLIFSLLCEDVSVPGVGTSTIIQWVGSN